MNRKEEFELLLRRAASALEGSPGTIAPTDLAKALRKEANGLMRIEDDPNKVMSQCVEICRDVAKEIGNSDRTALSAALECAHRIEDRSRRNKARETTDLLIACLSIGTDTMLHLEYEFRTDTLHLRVLATAHSYAGWIVEVTPIVNGRRSETRKEYCTEVHRYRDGGTTICETTIGSLRIPAPSKIASGQRAVWVTPNGSITFDGDGRDVPASESTGRK